MKKQMIISMAMGCFALLSGCATAYTVTDSVTLYPANQSAQKWGVINFYSQYQSNQLPNKLSINLPNGNSLSGQLTYIENSGTAVEDDDWFNNVSIGVGHGFHHGYWGVGWVPRIATYRSNIDKVSINAFGDKLGMNCRGEFNRHQQTGTLDCQFTNGMNYRGTIRRITVK